VTQPPRAPAGAPDPAGFRDELRRRFLAEIEASSHGGPQPNLESFVAPFEEPERSELRAELEALRQSSREREASLATVDPTPGATTDLPPDAGPQQEATVDYAPASQGGTGTPIDTDLGETADYHPRGGTEAETPGQHRKRTDIPQSVAGYEILGVLGRGAMGIVYKARQRGLKRLAALKMILTGDHAGEQELLRFRGEAESVAHLQHPNIVQIYEVGEDDGRPFFSLEFVDGSSLDKKVRGTPFPPKEAAVLVQKLAVAMQYAHEHGIIHRDLKPANVLLTQDGTPKIGDFGLAKQVEEDSGQTTPGTVLGTPSYMAPEQAEGKLEEVGPLSDLYSLGAILYELLTGRPPFKGSSIFDTLEQVRTMEPVPPMEFQPGVPRDLETICLKCLQKDAAKRYASDQALAEDLGRFLAGEPILARPVGPTERLWRWCKRNPRVATLITTVALLFIGWAISASALAGALKVQTDEAHKQTLIAQENEGKAKDQEVIAKQKKKEAEESAEEATKQKGIAQDNEKRAKDTAERTIEQMVNLGSNVHDRLDSTLLTPVSAQELRQQFLDVLKQSLVLLSRTIEGQGTTKYGTSRVCQALGDIHLGAGQSVEATKMYQQGYDAMKKLAQAEPEDDQTQTNFAMTILRLGDVSLQAHGDARTALAIYKRAREVDEAVLKRPGRRREEWKAKVDVSHTDVRVAWALLGLGQSAEAGKYLDEARTYRQNWLDMDSKNWEAS
jgi:serine/threonine protein kinase